MRSKHADLFNHDLDATGYDDDVLNAEDPIRAGYEDVLNWVIERAGITAESVVLDLGSGTGNLSARIQKCGKLVCVDVSKKMTEIAKPKLQHLKKVSFVIKDILEYFDDKIPKFDAIISTFTIHHLVEEEKQHLFKKIWEHLKPGGRAVFGDLMLESEALQDSFIKKYREMNKIDVAQAIQEEFFWFVDSAVQELREIGFQTDVQRFSDLSWGIAAIMPRQK
jgi:putative AdoMet-dependent methyltransferase